MGHAPSTEELPRHGKGTTSTPRPETEKERKEAAIVVIADKPWQEVAFAVSQKNRKPTS